jgi:hypothetical protein
LKLLAKFGQNKYLATANKYNVTILIYEKEQYT